ncbi:hypothetical protein MMUR_41170 [Mycolicibacterium murale]|jgi:hypothetical protein|uniref:Diacylglycerol O-acyltransferase n=1 Tax=Mycolicibacterium murale TaxID=182220 RepID=A0A7I9WQG1_9MYCO|nr:hypothetical protein [Mycolicibacterium murale]ANW64644.1 hypothetical protein BCA37_14550 [Mycobacterium sp. djl-10]MCV7183253.1 hypothetical protein [Mycolicibacterium murale]GFG59981.1 hypothetical protein MMUR_41170 [Mycolicibacterium murale]
MTRRDDRLDYIDQASFLSIRATGRQQLGQLVWLYEHPVDYDALRRFHRNYGHGLVGRRIERSPLPFGRHRWVADVGTTRELEISSPRPREDLNAWMDEQAELPIDPEHGPGWRVGVLPMTDGSTAVSAVLSHTLADGIGLLLTSARAATGEVTDFDYPARQARTRRRALASDAAQTIRDLPEVGRTLAAAAKLAYKRRGDLGGGDAPSPTPTGADEHVVVPTAAAFVSAAEWDARAEALGGNSYSLMAGFVSRLAIQMGRHRPDGTVSLLVAMSDRTEGDTRGNAVSLATVVVDPAPVAEDLSAVRAAMKKGLQELKDTPDETFALLPLNPFVPKKAVQRTAGLMFGDLPVSCSNVGPLDPAVNRPDGTDAEYLFLRPVDQGVTRHELERVGGHLVVASGRLNGTVSIGVVGYKVGGANTHAALRATVTQVLAEFGLTGTII